MNRKPLVPLFAVVASLSLVSSAFAAPHGILWARGAGPSAISADKAGAAGGLQYYGGPIIPNANVYAVFWGDNVDPEVKSGIGAFYANMLDSTYIDLMGQYGTSITAVDGRQGTNQKIGRGKFAGSVTITPVNGSSSLSDADIQKELDGQIAAGHLAPATENNLYMIYFPSGVSISIDGQQSCSSFCAYHEGFKSARDGSSVYYGVMPVCGFGCGIGGSAFDSMTIVSSHECMEAITDPFPTPGDKPAYPQAWNDEKGQEVGDLCTSGNATVTGHGITSAVQWEYDNSIGGCNQGPWQQTAAAKALALLGAPEQASRPLPLLEAASASANVFAGR